MHCIWEKKKSAIFNFPIDKNFVLQWIIVYIKLKQIEKKNYEFKIHGKRKPL